MRRIAVSFAALPLFVMFLSGLVACPATGCSLEQSLAASVVPLFAAFYFFPVQLVAVVPLAFLLLRRGWIAWWHFASAGALLGLFGSLPHLARNLFNERLHFEYRLQELFGLWMPTLIWSGIAVLFWLAALWRNQEFRLRIKAPSAA